MSTGQTRTLMAAAAHPTQQLGFWAAGSGRVAWESEPFMREGSLGDSSGKNHLMTLSSGDEQDPGGIVRVFLGDTMLVLGPGNVPRTVSLSGGRPLPVPAQLTAFLKASGTWASNTGNGPAFSWGRATTPVKGADGKEIGTGPASWDLWWQGNPPVVEITAPTGYFVGGVNPIAPDYAVATFVRAGQPIADDTGSEEILIDLRDHSYAPLTAGQNDALSSTGRAIALADLPRLSVPVTRLGSC
ncbi:hypothetical protein [Streptacidiphilus sp. PAMC 29251]